MKQEPTLADTLYRLTFNNKFTVLTPELRNQIAAARKFVLDDAMSGYMADLGWAAFVKTRTLQQRQAIVDNARRLARLPHAATWIEWNETALAKRAVALYNSNIQPDIVPKKTGWLMMQHPQIETAFKAISFGIGGHLTDGIQPVDPAQHDVGLCPFAFQWRSDDEPLAWHQHWVVDDLVAKRKMSPASMLTGIIGYDGPISLCGAEPHLRMRNYQAMELRALVQEQFGMMRYVLALLATINDLPIGEKKIVAAKGFVARGRYRKFLDHSIITLTVPETRYRALARRVVTNLRRRAHQVRGHWRDDWRNPGQRIWIREHQRGDASLGFVTHDYDVKHEPV